MKRLLTVALATGITLGVPAMASAAPYQSTADIACATTTPAAGANFVCTVSGFKGGESVTVSFNGVNKSVTTNGAGSGSVTLTAPNTAGAFTLTATGATSKATDTITVTVVVETTPGGGLPATGSESDSMMQLAVGATVLGAGMVAVTAVRRRRIA